jgi:hypothetical protein
MSPQPRRSCTRLVLTACSSSSFTSVATSSTFSTLPFFALAPRVPLPACFTGATVLTAGFGFSSTSSLAELGSVSSDSASEEADDEASLSAFYKIKRWCRREYCEFR